MQDDLMSLRMLLVSDATSRRAIWRDGAGLASVPIIFNEAASSDARAQLRDGLHDLVMLDGDLVDAHGLLQASCSLTPKPFIVVSAPKGTRSPPTGADGIVRHPEDVDGARHTINRCVKARMPARALIVDDSSTMRIIVRKILEASRYRMHISDAPGPDVALTTIREGAIDFAFVDYNMPGANGIEMITAIRRHAPHTAVVMITAVLDPTVSERALAAGATAFLKKPFYPKDIDGILEAHFGLAGPC